MHKLLAAGEEPMQARWSGARSNARRLIDVPRGPIFQRPLRKPALAFTVTWEKLDLRPPYPRQI